MAQYISMYGVQTLLPTTDNNFSLIVNTNTRGENTNEVRLLVDTSAQVVPSIVNIYLPTILSFNGFWTTQIFVVDISGNAGTFPIHIYATGGDTINGSPLAEINNDYGNCVVNIANAGSWSSYGNSGSGGGGGGGVVTTTFNNFYTTMSGGNLVAGTTYRITDYQSSNYINGWQTANTNFPPPTLPSGTRVNTYNNPPLPSLTFPTALCVLSDGSSVVGTASGNLRKLDPSGNEIVSFTTNVGLGGNGNSINSIAVQSDGKIIVGGNFFDWDGNVVGKIVRLNPNGTYDATFTTNIGSGFDTTIYWVAVQSDDKIVVGGSFTQLNGNPQNYFARLNSDGSDDAVFNASVMGGGSFDGVVAKIIIQPDTNILVYGLFSNYQGNPTSYLTRLDTFANLDFVFNANITFGGGFNNIVNDFALQTDGSIVVVGDFTNFNFTPINRIVRVFGDGSEDFGFTAQVGTGANNPLYDVIVNPTGGLIYCWGLMTDFNGTSVNIAFCIDTFGSIVLSFNYGGFSIPTSPRGIGIQTLNQYLIVCDGGLPNVVAILLSPTPFPNYDAREVYTSPNVETLVVKAVDNFNIEPIAFSEQFPQDIITYLPQVNNLGFSVDIYNGQILPDTSVVAGFDLQWDGTRAYFNMPTGYPVQMGQFLYIYCDFSDGKYLESFAEPIYFGVNQTNNFQADLNSSVEVVNNQTRVYLNDLSNAQFLLYNPSSLYVNSIYADTPCKGWISQRIDNADKITYSSDWRNQKYRRYDMVNGNYGTIKYYTAFQLNINAESFFPNGVFSDHLTLNWENNEIYNVQVLGNGYTTNWWYGQVGNNVFLNNVEGISSDGYIDSNTIFNVNAVKIGWSLNRNFFANVNTTDIDSDFSDNVFVDDVSICTIHSGFQNLCSANIFNCQFGRDFSYNTFKDGSYTNVVFGSLFNANTFNLVTIINAVFGNSTSNNNLIGCTITNWKSGLELFSNNFNGTALNNTLIGDNFNNNTINGGTWQSNTIDNSFIQNTIDSTLFNYNTIGKLCTNNYFDITSIVERNTIGRGFIQNAIYNNFIDNTLGQGYQNNQFTGSFANNVGGDYANGNTFGANFQQNTWGYTFSNNNFRGTIINNRWSNETFNNEFGINIRGNEWGSYCFGNTIDVNQSSGNFWGENFLQNTIQVNWLDQNFCSVNFGQNTIGSVAKTGFFTNNQINVSFGQNNIGDVRFTNNNINMDNLGSGFLQNTIDSNFRQNTINGNFTQCITAGGTLVNFFQNDIRTNNLGVDFSLSTYVYADYFKQHIKDNGGVNQLLYFDNATLTWLSVTPTNS